MILLNGGMPRSATVWAFNVTAMILEKRGVNFRRLNANSPAEVDAAIASYEKNEVLLIHFHDVSPGLVAIAGKGHVRISYSYRDPRDIVCSQMKLHQASFEKAVSMTEAACRNMFAALNLPGILPIPFYSITHHREAVVFQLAFYIGRMIGLGEVVEICDATSKEKFRAIMKKMEERGGEGAETVYTGRRHIRYAPETLITDRHIQSGKQGRWREELDEAQRARVNEVFGNFVARIID